jgi:hypothetical protein
MHVDCDCFMPLVRVCSIHFYLLERLSNISIFSIIPELVHYRDELLMILVQAAYDIAGDIALHHSTSKVTDHLTSIVCSVIEDMALMANGIQVELLDLMVCALCQDEKRKNQNGFAMMRKVIASCPINFQPYLERQLHQVFPLRCHFRSRLTSPSLGCCCKKKKCSYPALFSSVAFCVLPCGRPRSRSCKRASRVLSDTVEWPGEDGDSTG